MRNDNGNHLGTVVGMRGSSAKRTVVTRGSGGGVHGYYVTEVTADSLLIEVLWWCQEAGVKG